MSRPGERKGKPPRLDQQGFAAGGALLGTRVPPSLGALVGTRVGLSSGNHPRLSNSESPVSGLGEGMFGRALGGPRHEPSARHRQLAPSLSFNERSVPALHNAGIHLEEQYLSYLGSRDDSALLPSPSNSRGNRGGVFFPETGRRNDPEQIAAIHQAANSLIAGRAVSGRSSSLADGSMSPHPFFSPSHLRKRSSDSNTPVGGAPSLPWPTTFGSRDTVVRGRPLRATPPPDETSPPMHGRLNTGDTSAAGEASQPDGGATAGVRRSGSWAANSELPRDVRGGGGGGEEGGSLGGGDAGGGGRGAGGEREWVGRGGGGGGGLLGVRGPPVSSRDGRALPASGSGGMGGGGGAQRGRAVKVRSSFIILRFLVVKLS